MKMLLGLTTVLTLWTSNSFAEQSVIFKFRKSYNPKNEVHYFADTKIENDCAFENLHSPLKPLWYMGEADGHFEGLNSTERSYFGPGYTTKNPHELKFSFEVLKKIASHLESTSLRAVSTYDQDTNSCHVKAFMTWDGKEVVIKDVYTKGRFWFFTWETEYVEFRGNYLNGDVFYKKIKVQK